MEKEGILEYAIVASEILRYITETEKDKGEKLSLDQAYEELDVPKDLRMTEEEFKNIISLYLSK